MARRWDAHRLDEPLTIDADVIAEFLDRYRKHEMADFVRDQSNGVAKANRRADALFQHCNMLAKRLEQYEPQGKLHDPHPKPESSD